MQHEENHEKVHRFHKRMTYSRRENISILQSEVKSAIMELKQGKRAEDDGILEYFKLGAEELVSSIIFVFNTTLLTNL
jgi:hypothetical protein